MTTLTADNSDYWLRRARHTATAANLAWWLQYFLPFLLVVNILFSVVLLYSRQQNWAQETVWYSYAGLVFLCGLVAWAVSRRHYLDASAGLLRLETHLGLENRLTTAAAGVVDWPEPPGELQTPWSLNAWPLARPLGFSLMLLIAGWLIPVANSGIAPPVKASEQPVAWTELETWVEELEREEVVEEPSLEELKEKLAELRDQPAEEWFSQSSLEAGENLRDQTRLELQELARQMETSATALSQMEQLGTNADASQLENALGEALRQMQMGTLQPNAELMQQLAKMKTAAQLKKLDPKQLKAVKEKLKNCSGTCAGIGGLSEEKLESLALKVCTLSPC